MNLELAKFFVGSIGLIILTIVALIFIWFGKLKMEEERENIKLLIRIILYLLLALAFFSNYSIATDSSQSNKIGFDIMPIFLFGLVSILLLYGGTLLDMNPLKYLGGGFAFSFILIFIWFVLKILRPEEDVWNLLHPISSTSIFLGVIIAVICAISLHFIFKKKK